MENNDTYKQYYENLVRDKEMDNENCYKSAKTIINLLKEPNVKEYITNNSNEGYIIIDHTRLLALSKNFEAPLEKLESCYNRKMYETYWAHKRRMTKIDNILFGSLNHVYIKPIFLDEKTHLKIMFHPNGQFRCTRTIDKIYWSLYDYWTPKRRN